MAETLESLEGVIKIELSPETRKRLDEAFRTAMGNVGRELTQEFLEGLQPLRRMKSRK